MTITITIDGDRVPVDVDAVFHNGSQGFRNSLGVPEEPDEQPGWEVWDVARNGEPINLTDDQMDEVYQRLNELES